MLELKKPSLLELLSQLKRQNNAINSGNYIGSASVQRTESA
jgi:hypothetical protein